jgi:hypothetical protein
MHHRHGVPVIKAKCAGAADGFDASLSEDVEDPAERDA